MKLLAPGTEIDGFRVGECIHAGGMAHIYAVEYAQEGRSPGFAMAMKIPRMTAGDGAENIVGFEVEQQILSVLSGPHVPRFVAAGDLVRLPYLVMEYVPGETLQDWLDSTPVPERSAERIAALGAATAHAAHSLHQQNVCHLDLKPANVLVRTDGSAVLLDFGLSCHAHYPDLLAEEMRKAVGSPAWIAPEQVVGVRGDPRSDIFAIGVMLYEMATGELPFGAPTTAGGLRQRLWMTPAPPRKHRADVPPWLQEIILRCLEIKPDARYETAAQLRFASQHPDDVVLTERASRRNRDGAATVFMRWFANRNAPPLRARPAANLLDRSPIIMGAIDLSPEAEGLRDALVVALRRVLATERTARFACVNVLKTSRIALDPMQDAHGRNPHLQRLVDLKHWARVLPVAEDRITYHVFESPDPAAAIIEYARNNNVDHIIMGARGASPLRRYLGSVSAQVVARAPCTVTVVRQPVAAFEMSEEQSAALSPGTERSDMG